MNIVKFIFLFNMVFKVILKEDLNVVTTKYGDLLGTIDKSTGNRVFLGIPYAAAPIGPLRFKPPQPPATWTNLRNADKFGPSCNPKFRRTIDDETFANQSEDCLFLNIWTPEKYNSLLPVMVWIHGGAFNLGSSSLPYYSGNNLSKQGNVIVVSFNYRLGILGFFTSENLSNEDPDWPTSGNYGLLDQIMALKWVKENIAAFGGDSENITIFGESAGSWSVCYHLLMPKSKGLFNRAILQSGFCSYPLGKFELRPDDIIPPQDKISQLTASSEYMKKLGCSDINCMRNLSEDEIRNFTNSYNIFTWPHVDGLVIPDDPYFMFKNGNYTKVDILAGTTLNEGTMFSEYISWAEFEKTIKKNFPIYYDRILKIYSNSFHKSAFSAIAQLRTDFVFYCPSRNFLNFVTANGSNAYKYRFVAVPSFLPEKLKDLGSLHTAEMYYLFNYPLYNEFNPQNLIFTEEELILSSQIIDFWSSFAKTGVPTSSNTLVKWEKYSQETKNHITLNVKELLTNDIISDDICDLYDLNMMSTLGFCYMKPLISLTFMIFLLILN